MHSATKYDVSPKFYVCTNPNCTEGHPHWANSGKPSKNRCWACGKTTRECKSEPRR